MLPVSTRRALSALEHARAESSQVSWQIAGGAVLLAYTVSLFVVRRSATGYSSLWDGWAGNFAATLPVIPVLLRVRRSPKLRSAWTLMAVGIALNSIGNLIVLLHDQNLHPIPNPAPSDLPFLLSMLAFIAGIAIMTQRAFGRGHVSVRLDGAVAGFAIGALAVMLWFGPVLKVAVWEIFEPSAQISYLGLDAAAGLCGKLEPNGVEFARVDFRGLVHD